MKQIVTFSITRFRNEEDFGYHKRVEALAQTYLTSDIDKPVVAEYVAAVAAFDDALAQDIKNSQTAIVQEADSVADYRWSGGNLMAKALAYHPDTAMASIGRRIADIFAKYGNFIEMPYNEEYGRLYNLLQELEAMGTEELGLVGFTPYYEAMVEAYDSFIAARASQTSEESQKQTGIVKETRVAADNAYRLLVQKVNGLVLVMGESGYASFIDQVNVMVADAQSTLKARSTNAGKEKADGETEEETA